MKYLDTNFLICFNRSALINHFIHIGMTSSLHELYPMLQVINNEIQLNNRYACGE